MDQKVVALGLNLAEVISRNTISYVGNKMKLAKEKKDLESQSLAYTEIINNLPQDKEELTTISMEYKNAYEQITISDADIEYLHSTLKNAINLLDTFVPQKEESIIALNTLVELLNKDTLKTFQLLGFNYKEAIGEPLTEMCAEAIKTKLKITSSNKNKSNPQSKVKK